MRRALFAVVLLGACGETEIGPPDVPAAAPDAPVDARASDGTLPPDLNACDDVTPCPMGDDCLRIPWLGGARRCARPCEHTADCGLDEVCYHGITDPRFVSLGDHCWLSYCTQPLGACSLGAEIQLDPAEQLPGTCLPLDDHAADATDGGVLGPIGQCLEAGNIPEDEPCALQNRVRSGEVCAQGTVCVGGALADIGRCARLCDPTAALDSCNPSRSCFDNSQGQTVRDPQSGQVLGQISATWGYCRVGTRCVVTAPGGVCESGTGCLPTNAVDPNGFCSTGGDGLLTVGDTCVPFGDVAPAIDERCREAYCDPAGADAARSGTCRAFCDEAHTCQSGSCVPYTWDEASANLTQGYGVCR